MSLDEARELEVWEVGKQTKQTLGCSAEGEAGTSGCTSTLMYCGQRGPECLASTLSLMGSESPVGQSGSGGLQLPRAAGLARPSVLK